jgi:hypothetical protein
MTHSVYGKFLKYDVGTNELLVAGSVKSVDPDFTESSGFNTPSPSKVVLFDDFMGDALNTDLYTVTEGTDSATSDAAIVTNAVNGILRITSGNAGTGLAADGVFVGSALHWEADNGGLTFETKLNLSAITTCQVFLGFSDTVATLEMPIDSAGSVNTITTTATDAVGFFFDTDMSTDTWWCAGVANGTDATHVSSGVSPTAATDQTFRITVDTSGNAKFYIDGAYVGAVANAVTATVNLTPCIVVNLLSTTTSFTVDVDYLYVSQNR